MFFGNFHKMELDDFEDSLKDIADDKIICFRQWQRFVPSQVSFESKVPDTAFKLQRLYWYYHLSHRISFLINFLKQRNMISEK
jgi:hypothetical protein